MKSPAPAKPSQSWFSSLGEKLVGEPSRAFEVAQLRLGKNESIARKER